MRCTTSPPLPSDRRVISSPQLASQSGQVRKAVRVDADDVMPASSQIPTVQSWAGQA
jgi:hypothetical protein